MQSAAARCQPCQSSSSWQSPSWEPSLRPGRSHLRKLKNGSVHQASRSATRKFNTLKVRERDYVRRTHSTTVYCANFCYEILTIQSLFQVLTLLFDPPPFDHTKLSIVHLPCSFFDGTQPPRRRRYTLTHNDITGDLLLSIGSTFNSSQLDGWYVKLIRCAY
jgi:Staygreen protein